MASQESDRRAAAQASRAAWASIAINILLSLLNLVIAVASGSLAVAAEMVHNLVDLFASIAVLAGVKISERESRGFPYGLYKVENVVAVGVAILIFFTGYEIAREALRGEGGPATVNAWMLVGVALSAVIPLVFSRYEMRVGREINSPSLMADAQEYRVHVFSSGVVLLALIGQILGVALDRYAALLIVVLIAKTGWELLVDGMRVLLDASLDSETLEQVRAIIQTDPAVTEIRSVVGRNAGRYRFLEADIALRVDDLEKAHAVSRRIEQALRAQVPHVDRVRIHYEPRIRNHLRYAVPLADPAGRVSEHFGEAPYFALVTVRTDDEHRSQSDSWDEGQGKPVESAAATPRVVHQEVLLNPHSGVEKAKGIRVGEWLVGLRVDIAVLREDVHGKGPAYVFADAGVETRRTGATTLTQAIAEQITRLDRGGHNG
jgi:cation diffusion facilitator family transporter